MATFEQTGTVTVTNGSRTVTGNGSAWLAGYDGTALNIAGAVYPVASIDSPNSLTLIEPYPGATASQLSYTLLPLKNENYDLSKKVQKIIDIAGELVDATVGPAGPAGEQGPQGPAGKSGDSGFGSIVNFSQYSPQPAGSPGVYMIVPVANGDPDGITLTQQAQVVIPYDKKNAGVGLWINSTTSGYAITLGLTNAPMPQPSFPKEELNLSGAGEIFVAPGSIFPLNLSIGETNKSFTITTPSGIPIKKTVTSKVPVTRSSDWTWNGTEFRPKGNAVDAAAIMPIEYSKDKIVWNGNRLVLDKNDYQSLASAALNTDFPITSDYQTSMVPAGVRLKVKCLIPAGGTGIIGMIGAWGTGEVTLKYNWTDELTVYLSSQAGGGDVRAGTNRLINRGTVQTYEVLWENNLTGKGGYVTFFVDGQQASDRIDTDFKPSINATSRVYIGSSHGNVNDAIPGFEFESCSVSFTKIEDAKTYEAVSDGSISVADLNSLVVDASTITSAVAQRVLTYSTSDGQGYTLGITIGEMTIPKYRAYKAVLEDWSSGVGVVHPNEMVMTKPVAQNVRFEDTALYGAQAAWTEVVPQGSCPNINGINYYCEGIRIGTYVQFQFFYDWDESKMPANPFGDPKDNESYMVPHKWLIYDTEGNMLGRVELPNGQPLNSASIKPAWEGAWDGVGNAMITSDNPHFNSGTVRSSVIWRSHDCEPYSKTDVWKRVPVFDQRVPFACYTGYSTNGTDMRLIYGNNGQQNGFGNWQVMSYEPTTYEEIQQLASEAGKKLPYNLLYYSRGVVPNAGIFLKYAPFNQMGRSPLTGPGGVRDDRQIMPEMVARYALDMESTHPMTGVSMRKIALDYLTGYASDPYHALEKGRPTPAYKGNARRKVTLRNHYYGPGEMSISPSAAWYIQSGRVSEWVRGSNPLRVSGTSGSANDPKRPIFGTNSIDDAHAHQFPHWGSLLFKSPEFAFLGHRMSDQPRLYDNNILYSYYGPGNITQRSAAWKFAHAALCWKTASKGSTRLYSRDEILDWVVFDFEQFYDNSYASTPGILNPPTNVMKDGQIDENMLIYAACARFGLANAGLGNREGIHTHDFMTGYWLSAIHMAERLGFNDAIRAASPKAKAIMDWLVAAHRKRIVGRIKNPLINSRYAYMTILWTNDQIYASGGDVSKLPQTFEEVDMAQNPRCRTWDEVYWPGDNGPEWGSRDGQACDQMLAGPYLLKDMGVTGTDIDQCITLSEERFQQKLAEEKARGQSEAGSKWFLYHQITNNRPIKPTS